MNPQSDFEDNFTANRTVRKFDPTKRNDVLEESISSLQKPICRSEETALKGLFLGPQAENQGWVSSQIQGLLHSYFEWRRSFRPEDGKAISSKDLLSTDYIQRRAHTEQILQELSARFESEIPKFSPRYIGHMFSEISLPALFGYFLTILHNPNNISGESSKVGVLIEEEAIESLSQMLGFENAVGHFTSGGTVANFEAVYRARARAYSWMSAGLAAGSSTAFESALCGWEKYDSFSEQVHKNSLELNPLEGNPFVSAALIKEKTGRNFLGPVILIPQHKHYSWVKAANVFGLGAEAFWPVQLDDNGHLDVTDLKKQILRAQSEDRPVLMVVSVLGTTELGMVDPVHEVTDLLEELNADRGWHIWHHIDAAYGGFLCSLKGKDSYVSGVLSEHSLKAMYAVGRVNSLTIDPHKLGYVPFSSAAFISSCERDYYQRAFGAPYVNFSVNKDKGPFTLEGSRSAAGAVATWMTAKCIGLTQEGYGRIIARTVRIRKDFQDKLVATIPDIQMAPSVDSNLLGFCIARKGESLKATNARTKKIFESFNSNNEAEFYISKTSLNKKSYSRYFEKLVCSWQGLVDDEELMLIRLCIMNPFFRTVEMKVDIEKLFIDTLVNRIKSIGE